MVAQQTLSGNSIGRCAAVVLTIAAFFYAHNASANSIATKRFQAVKNVEIYLLRSLQVGDIDGVYGDVFARGIKNSIDSYRDFDGQKLFSADNKYPKLNAVINEHIYVNHRFSIIA